MSCACLINLHHSTDGNFSSHVLRPEILLFLKVCIACSDELMQLLCGLTNCIYIYISSRYFLTALKATLSVMLNTGLKPIFVRHVMFYLNVEIVEVYVNYFTGFANIALDDQSYITNIAVFPSLDRIGNLTV